MVRGFPGNPRVCPWSGSSRGDGGKPKQIGAGTGVHRARGPRRHLDHLGLSGGAVHHPAGGHGARQPGAGADGVQRHVNRLHGLGVVPLFGDTALRMTTVVNGRRFIRDLARGADDARMGIAELGKDRSRALIHDLLVYLRLDRFAQEDNHTRAVMIAQAQAKHEQSAHMLTAPAAGPQCGRGSRGSCGCTLVFPCAARLRSARTPSCRPRSWIIWNVPWTPRWPTASSTPGRERGARSGRGPISGR